MWQRQFRDYPGLVYRKRYKCSTCKEYLFRVEHDGYGECANGCNAVTEKLKLQNIIESDDFEGMFSNEELDEYFTNIDDIIEERLESIIKNQKTHLYTKKDNIKIQNAFKKSNKIDDSLDDFMILYYRKFSERETEKNITGINDIEYVINLIEDCHFFANKALNELKLYEFVTEKYNTKIFYSGRFIINNAVFHTIVSWERLINILAIIFNIHLDDNVKRNTFNNLHKKLRKNTSFQSTTIFERINKIKSDGVFGQVDNIRKCNDHDITEHLNLMRSMIEEEHKVDSNFDKKLKPISQYIMENINTIFENILETVSIFESKVIQSNEKITLHKSLKVDVNNNYEKIITGLNDKNPLTTEEFEIINSQIAYIIQLSDKELNDTERNYFKRNDENFRIINNLFVDIIFRAMEVSKCFIDILNCENNTIYKIYPFPTHLINKQYFIYSSISRIYSIYDKFGKLILFLYEIENMGKSYFEDVVSISLSDNSIKNLTSIKKADEITKSEEFIQMCDLRNRLFHIIRPGVINGKDTVEIYENKMLFLAYENLLKIIELIKIIKNDIEHKYKLLKRNNLNN